MTQAEAVLLAYLIVTSIAGHIAFFRWRDRQRKHKIRSKAARKAADTRRRNAEAHPQPPRSKEPPTPRKRKPKTLTDNVVTTDSAWFTLPEDQEPDYNEIDLGALVGDDGWKPEVRRFDGGAIEYAHRDQGNGSVAS